MPKIHRFILLFGLFGFCAACNSPDPSFPRPYGFHRINFPQSTVYQTFQNESCPFTFEYPDFGVISRDNPDSCWVDILFPQYDCKWHLTYRNIVESGRMLPAHFEEYRRLVYKHTKKASEIRETGFSVAAGGGVSFELYGNVGIPEQFFLTDTTENIALTSFYYQTALKNDSLAPVSVYMKAQLKHMRESFRWRSDTQP
jgi:gliding motility-associated lipoprotein GldD